eukprot:5605119-Amphidinium_carterae.1
MENAKRQTTPIYDDSFIEQELDKPDLSTFEADRRKDTELQRLTNESSATDRGALPRNAAKKRRKERNEPASEDEAPPQVPELPDNFEPFTEKKTGKTIHDYKEAFHYYNRVLQYTPNKVFFRGPHWFILTTMQSLKRERI